MILLHREILPQRIYGKKVSWVTFVLIVVVTGKSFFPRKALSFRKVDFLQSILLIGRLKLKDINYLCRLRMGLKMAVHRACTVNTFKATTIYFADNNLLFKGIFVFRYFNLVYLRIFTSFLRFEAT